MSEIAILVPVLNRPERAGPLVESVLEATAVSVRVLFLCSPGDDREMLAALQTEADVVGVPFAPTSGDYARKINYGIGLTTEPWVLQAADDLRFHRGWDEEALAYAEREHIGVIGTNDLGNPLVRAGRHATHSLIRRSYVEAMGTIDEPGKALHEGYHHCWVDNELVETAVARNAWAAARRSHVEHLHWVWQERGGGRKGQDDATYRRGQEQYHRDHELFKARRSLWRSSGRAARFSRATP